MLERGDGKVEAVRGLLGAVEECHYVLGLTAKAAIELESTLSVGPGHLKVMLEDVDDAFVDGSVDGEEVFEGHAEGGHDEIVVEVIEEERALHEHAGHLLRR